MEVVVQSTLPHVPGELIIPTSSDQTVDSLIATFCANKGVHHQSYYVLRTSEQEDLNGKKRLDYYDVHDGDTLLLGVKTYNDEAACGINQWWILAAVALLIGIVGLVAISLLRSNGNKPVFQYGVVIDAGSTGSRVFVYKWDGEKENGTAVARQISVDCKATPGLSGYVDNPAQAGESLRPCMDKAGKSVPSFKHSSTPLFLGATAGMRLLQESDPNATQAILQSVRDTLSSYNYNFTDPVKQARIIAGSEEGAFGWVTVNYLADTFGQLSTITSLMNTFMLPETFGALDLGGASTQITYLPEKPLPDDKKAEYEEELLLYGGPYGVYTHSYLCYGNNEARRKFHANLIMANNYSLTVNNPCTPDGNATSASYQEIFKVPCSNPLHEHPDHENDTYTFVGQSNSSECHRLTRALFNTTECEECGDQCTFDCIYQPSVYGNFKAFAGFYYVTSFLNLTANGSFTLDEFKNATEQYCSLTWEEAASIPNVISSYLTTYCFGAHYIDILLTDGYGFNEDNWHTISFQDKVADSDLGWSLGFMLNSSNTLPVLEPTTSITLTLFIILIIIFIGFLFFAVLFGCQARKTKKKQYQKLSTYGTV